ncbi:MULTISPECIES: hypothetical protein [Vibrio]|uniref:hypothetical protein n=2 Tax=Vibrionaceae TaxID=641 RepID=UPI00221E7681|nr:hypothetical protein [Vibrio owensii]
MINRYLNKLIKDFKNAKWDSRIKNLDGSPFPKVLSNKLEIKPTNDKSNVLIFHNTHNTDQKVYPKTKLKRSWLIPNETKMALALFLNHKLQSCNIDTVVSASRRVMGSLTLLNLQPHELTQNNYSRIIENSSSKTNLARFNAFINWCVKNEYCELIRPQAISDGGIYDGHKRRLKKLPDVSSVLALGDIFCQTIPTDRTLWDTSPNTSQANALMSIYSALCLASPNRMCAEVITLQKQELLKFQTKDKEGNDVTLHSLMWQGSKNYKDNENHVGSWIAEQLERGIEYFDLVTAPYRILAAFWTNQKSTIKELFPVINDSLTERLDTAKLTLSDTPNFIQLGYLLGFYQGDTFKLNIDGPNKNKSTVHVSEFSGDFKVFFGRTSGLGKLLGYKQLSSNSSLITQTKLKFRNFTTINELQQYIYQIMTRDWPSFPDLSMGESQNKTLILNAMWCLTGYSINGDGGYYQLIKADTIVGLVRKKLTQGNLFKDFNFSVRLKVTPHNLRHFINHNGYINGVPDYILNMWSGRQDSEHLIHYIHESEEDKLARIPMVTEQIKVENITVTSEQEYAKQRRLVDGATSRTSVGFCSKDLRYSPCTYLSEFETQCTFCENSCHVAHDEAGIRVLEDDYEIQCGRLISHLSSPKKNNKNQKQWFKMHKANTYLLHQLIDTLKDKSIRPGSVVRVITDVQQIRIADLTTKSISNRKLQLDIMDEEIQEGLSLLEYKKEKTQRDKETDAFLDKLWGDL